MAKAVKKSAKKITKQPDNSEKVTIINSKQLSDLNAFIENIPTKHGLPLMNFLNSLEKTTRKNLSNVN